MELRLLQYYLAAVREGNVSKAADALHVTQPALSRQMGQLEDELGAQLFVRGRHLELTDAGVMLQRRAEEVTALVEKIQDDFSGTGEIGGVISIGSGGLYSSRILPALTGWTIRISHGKKMSEILRRKTTCITICLHLTMG